MPKRKPVPAISSDEIAELADAMGCDTQQDLADRLGVTQPRVSQILSGTNPIRPGSLLHLVRELQARYVSRNRELSQE